MCIANSGTVTDRNHLKKKRKREKTKKALLTKDTLRLVLAEEPSAVELVRRRGVCRQWRALVDELLVARLRALGPRLERASAGLSMSAVWEALTRLPGESRCRRCRVVGAFFFPAKEENDEERRVPGLCLLCFAGARDVPLALAYDGPPPLLRVPSEEWPGEEGGGRQG